MPHGVPAQKQYLFTDFRHILCSDLRWLDAAGQPVPLAPQGPTVDLHVDEAQIPRGLRLVTQPGQKTDPLPPSPWPRRRIVYENGMYRAWGPREAGPNGLEICCTESRDGFDWRLVHSCTVRTPGTSNGEGFGVFKDPNAPPAERYKAVYCAEPPRDEWPAMLAEYMKVHRHHRIWRLGEHMVFAVYGLVSPDGLNWTPLPKHLMVNFADSDTSVYFDAEQSKYVMFTRLMLQQRRWIGRAESDDFRTWGPIQPMIGPSLDGPMTDDIYQNGFCRYPGEDAYYLMFPMIYHRQNQRSSIHLYSSDDGIAWLKVPGEPLIEPGPLGSFDSEFLAVGKDLVPMGSDRIALPYMGTRYPHKYPRWPHVMDAVGYAWATWPRGRISALRADGDGRFFTFPLEPMGRALRLNARISHAGDIRVGIVGSSRHSIEQCNPITGDGVALPVQWKPHEAIALDNPTQPITLEFHLRAADIFGFEWV